MERVNVQVVMLVALAAVLVSSSPVMAARGGLIRQPSYDHSGSRSFFHRRGWNGVLCLPDVTTLLEKHEGRHKCAYDHENGYRAVGVGYNLDDHVGQRRKELSGVGVDYDEVYKGDSCLNDLQISALMILDAKRALDRARNHVKRLDDLCCSVEAVFADIQHSAGAADNFPKRDLERFIEKAAKEEFESAADELGKSKWCSREENSRRCDDNVDVVARGC